MAHIPPEHQSLSALLEAAPGDWSYAASRLDREHRLLYQADVVRPSASLIKVPILVALYRAVEEGTLHLDETVVMRREDQVTGSGVLKDLTPGTPWCLRDLATLMITVSDNTATNLLLDRLTTDWVNDTARHLGLQDTVVLRRLQRLPVGAVGMNHTTAADLLTLMTAIARGEAVSRAVSAAVADVLARCQAPAMVVPETAPGLDLVGEPPRLMVHHKTGLLANFRGDAGYGVWPGGGYAYCLLAHGAPEDHVEPWMQAIGRALAREMLA